MKNSIDILIIDDEQVVRDAVVKIAALENLLSDSSYDAIDALEKISNNNYKLIICDIMMPQMNGFQFLDECHKLKIISPIIMTTGYSTLEYAVKSLYKGAIDFIPKPFTADEILCAIKRGINYENIQKKIKAGDHSIVYVSCPAKYLRLGYSSWVYIEEKGTALIGLTDLFIKTIESIKEVELIKNEEEILQGSPSLFIKDYNDAVHHVCSPLTGKIIERNEKVLTDPSLIEKDPYFSGWLYRIIPSNKEEELKNLIHCSSDRI